MLVDVQTLELAVPVDPEVPGAPDGPDCVHHEQGDAADRDHAGEAADGLGLQLVQAATVEQALHLGGDVGPIRSRDTELARGP